MKMGSDWPLMAIYRYSINRLLDKAVYLFCFIQSCRRLHLLSQ